MDPLTIGLITAAITAASSIGSSVIANKQNKPTPIQGQQKELIDQMMSSLKDDGPYSNLFNVDEASFKKSFVDPMKQKFQSEIAPQIQQSYITNGQQGGTGMQNALTRAGVDMDQLLNQFYFLQQQGAQNRQAGAMSNMLGQPSGPQAQMSSGQAALQGLGGYLQGGTLGKDIGSMLNNSTKNEFQDNRDKNSLEDLFLPSRKGFERDRQTYDYRTGKMGGY